MVKTIGKYVVRLTAEEREYLIELTKTCKASAKKILHARILLRTDAEQGGENRRDREVKDLENISRDTVSRIRQLFVEEGLEAALNRKPHKRTKPRVLDGEQEAKLVAVCCSQAPEGRVRWTLKLLADRLVEMEIVQSIAPETVRQTLKKMNLSLG
ncbi:MAG: helix-turn-helix domain-containing protein [Bacteroidia bacterium]